MNDLEEEIALLKAAVTELEARVRTLESYVPGPLAEYTRAAAEQPQS